MKTQMTPPFKPARRIRLHEEIVGQIRDLIEQGELKSGDKLPPERRLAEIFGVSRHCVREAIRALEQQKIVTSRLGDGTYVLDDAEESLVEPFAAIIEQRRSRQREVLEFRRLLEPQIAALAAVHVSDDDLAALRRALDTQIADTEQGCSGSDADVEFHMIIARATRNTVVQEVLTLLHDILSDSRDFTLQTGDRRNWAVSTHARILAAMEARDPQAAFQAMHEHILHVEEIARERSGE